MECPAITEMGYYIRLDDEVEFKAAKKEGKVDEDTYNAGYKIAIDLMQELREQKIVTQLLYQKVDFLELFLVSLVTQPILKNRLCTGDYAGAI